MAKALEHIVCAKCGYGYTLTAAEAKAEKLCRNCIQPLVRRAKPRGLVKASDIPFMKQLARELRPSPIKERLVEAAAAQFEHPDDPLSILYQHTAFCQTTLPYRDPGSEVRVWERSNGDVHLKVTAGDVLDPDTGGFVPVGLPFGPKARLVLMHINQQAIVSQSPIIEVQSSLTKFVHRTLKLDPNGRTIRSVKDQLTRLAAASIRLGLVRDGHAYTVNSQIVNSFDIWFKPGDPLQVRWPSRVRLSLDYWETLKEHAVPLNEAAIAALSHNAMALDIYAWLAQRLHRVPHGKPAFIAWTLLHVQFGLNYGRLNHFRAVFKDALKQVFLVYPAARFKVNRRGITLWNSPPPVRRGGCGKA